MTKKEVMDAVIASTQKERHCKVFIKNRTPIIVFFTELEDGQDLLSKGMVRAVNAGNEEGFHMTRKTMFTRIFVINDIQDILWL